MAGVISIEEIKNTSVEKLIENRERPRYLLYKLIKEQMRQEKLSDMGNPNNAEEKAKEYQKLVDKLINKCPELESEVDTVIDFCIKKFYK